VLYNGPLECRFVKYELYQGSKKAKFQEWWILSSQSAVHSQQFTVGSQQSSVGSAEKPEIYDFIVFRVSSKNYENWKFSIFRDLQLLAIIRKMEGMPALPARQASLEARGDGDPDKMTPRLFA
jgi:hypothetical protein